MTDGKRILLACFTPVALALAVQAAQGGGAIPDLLGDFNCERVVLHKTHQTGSAILAQILHRVGAARGKRFLLPETTPHRHRHNGASVAESFQLLHELGAAVSANGIEPPDFVTVHKAVPLVRVRQEWLDRVGPHLEPPGFLTAVREPVSRFISHFYYYGWSPYATAPSSKARLRDGQAADINAKMLQYFPISQAMEVLGLPAEGGNSAQQGLQVRTEEVMDNVRVLLAEQLLEGVAALHLHCGWPLRHLSFASVHCSGCWDMRVAEADMPAVDGTAPGIGASLADASPLVTAETQMEIAKRTVHDGVLYSSARGRWEAVMQRGGQSIKEVAREMQRRNSAIDAYCRERIGAADDFQAHPGCLWAALEPVEFLRLIGEDGRVGPNRTFTPSGKHRGYPGGGRIQAWQMIAGYEAMCDELFGPEGMMQQP